MTQFVRFESSSPGISTVTLQRPQCRNALSIDLLQQFCDIVVSLESDDANRVIILTGAGRDFCAGLDLREAIDPSLAEQAAAGIVRLWKTLRESQLIVIAAAHGGTYAGGAGLLAASDIAIAAEDASIGFPTARRGLVPALACPYIRPRVRDGELRDLFLSGQPVSGIRAYQIGLVQRVVPREKLMAEARNVADAVVAGGPEAIRRIKRLFDSPSGSECADGPGQSAWIDEHLGAYSSDEAKEGIAAFVEKRAPSWEEADTD